MSCASEALPLVQKFRSQCRSVHSDADDPGTEPGSVRAELLHSLWEFTALPDGRTHIHFENHVRPPSSPASPSMNLPWPPLPPA